MTSAREWLNDKGIASVATEDLEARERHIGAQVLREAADAIEASGRRSFGSVNGKPHMGAIMLAAAISFLRGRAKSIEAGP